MRNDVLLNEITSLQFLRRTQTRRVCDKQCDLLTDPKASGHLVFGCIRHMVLGIDRIVN